MTDDLAPDRFSSALAERLLRRATEPVGVIDLRGSQQRYERATSWPRRHVSLLDRWVSRYGNEAQPDQGAQHVVAARHLDALMPATDVPIPARASVPPRASSSGESRSSPVETTRSETGRQDATHHHEAHIGPVMRAAPLARARSPLISRSPSATADSAVAVPGSKSDAGRREVVAGSATRGVPESEPLVAGATSSEPTSVPVMTSPGTEVVSAVTSRGTKVPAVTRASSAAIVDARIAVEASVVPAPDARRPHASATVTPHATAIRASEIGRPAVPSSNVLVQRRLAAPEARTPPALPDPIELTVARSRAPIATPIPEEAVFTVSPTLAGDGSTATGSPHTDERAQTLGPPTHGAQTQGAHTPGALPRPDIVQTPASARPLASAQPLLLSHRATPVVQRVLGTDASSSELVWRKVGVPGSGGAVAAPSFSLAGVSSQLAEQVTRRLLRQIAVERERRGGSRWP